jgi:hypothetical protein
MHCGDCDNIPFWRWLKGNQTFPTSITCNDYDGEKLSNLQPNRVIPVWQVCSKDHIITSKGLQSPP